MPGHLIPHALAGYAVPGVVRLSRAGIAAAARSFFAVAALAHRLRSSLFSDVLYRAMLWHLQSGQMQPGPGICQHWGQ